MTTPDDVTPEALYLRRRDFIRNASLMTVTALTTAGGLWAVTGGGARARAAKGSADGGAGLSTDEPLTAFDDVTTYNNYYEFGLGKGDPAEHAHTLTLRPWTVTVTGEVKAERTFDLDELTRLFPPERRVYRMRCVEAWSMVIPWQGFELRKLLELVEPTSRAKYVAFETLVRPSEMPGQKTSVLAWPYVEGLRLDEAMHPLTLLATGLYDQPLLGQNGAPLRLVVPWKYGFKGIKSIVRIRLLENQPPTTWNLAAPGEYGFFANVNPEVDHPRWSQATERRIGDFMRRPTLPFNGYADQVASLYTGMNLKEAF